MKTILTILILALAVPAHAQTSKPVKPPVIPDTVKLQFQTARADVLQAQLAIEQAQQNQKTAQAAWQAALAALQKTCGEKFQPYASATGELTCVPKPEK